MSIPSLKLLCAINVLANKLDTGQLPTDVVNWLDGLYPALYIQDKNLHNSSSSTNTHTLDINSSVDLVRPLFYPAKYGKPLGGGSLFLRDGDTLLGRVWLETTAYGFCIEEHPSSRDIGLHALISKVRGDNRHLIGGINTICYNNISYPTLDYSGWGLIGDYIWIMITQEKIRHYKELIQTHGTIFTLQHSKFGVNKTKILLTAKPKFKHLVRGNFGDDEIVTELTKIVAFDCIHYDDTSHPDRKDLESAVHIYCRPYQYRLSNYTSKYVLDTINLDDYR